MGSERSRDCLEQAMGAKRLIFDAQTTASDIKDPATRRAVVRLLSQARSRLEAVDREFTGMEIRARDRGVR